MIPFLYELAEMMRHVTGVDIGDTPARMLRYTSVRMVGAFVGSFLFVYFVAPHAVGWLYRRGMRDRPRDYDETFNRSKSGTPTMGGLLIVGATVSSALIFCDFDRMMVPLLVLTALWFGGLGAVDDVMKARGGGGDAGLSRGMKFFLQISFGVLFAVVVLADGSSPFADEIRTQLFLPFPGRHIVTPPDLGVFYGLFIVVFIVATANAINFADGLDGLAAFPCAMCAGVFGLFAYLTDHFFAAQTFGFVQVPGMSEVTVFAAGIVGACIGFVWYNGYPAQIFMGDTGSQALGGMLGGLAILSKQELLFVIAGGFFVIEAASVLLQDYLGIRRIGRRLFFRAPIHHSYQHRGVAEPKVVLRFWIVSLLCAVLSVATLKLR